MRNEISHRVARCPAPHTGPTTATRIASRSSPWRLRPVRNVYSQPLTAFIIELVDYPGSSFSHWQDNLAGSEIPPGVEKAYPVKSMLVGAVSPEYVKVQAAIYADSSASGNPEKIKQLIEVRRLRLETTRELIRRIEKSQSSGLPKADIIDDFKRWQESSGRIARAEITAAIGNLDKQSIADVLDTLKRTDRSLASSTRVLP